MHHITSLVGLKYTVEQHAVAIREQDDYRVSVYQETAGHLQKRVDQIILPAVQYQNATIEEAVEYLRVSRGCLDLNDGENVVPHFNFILHLREGVKRPPVSLALKDIPLGEALRYCVEISGVKLRYDAFAAVLTDEESRDPGGSLPESLYSRLILPAMDLSGATLEESLGFIRFKSQELSPDHREIQVMVTPGVSKTSINLALKSIPIIEALRYIAETSYHTLSYDGRSYVLTPVGVK